MIRAHHHAVQTCCHQVPPALSRGTQLLPISPQGRRTKHCSQVSQPCQPRSAGTAFPTITSQCSHKAPCCTFPVKTPLVNLLGTTASRT